jgi:O-methyltransferase involved in polyketide biosynthesis
MERLSGVAETLLMCLYARYLETLRPDAIIRDEKSVEMIRQIDFDFRKFSSMRLVQVSTAIRTQIFDQRTQAVLERHPDTVVVSLGAGLCTRFFRVDNGRLHWFALDIEQVRPLWERLIGESDRLKFRTTSVLDFSWMEAFKQDQDSHFLFIAEGLLMYFTEAQVRRLITGLAREFSGADMLLDAFGPLGARSTWVHPIISKTEAEFKWGVASLQDLEDWGRDICLLGEWFYLDYYPLRWGWMSSARFIPFLRREMKAGQFRFGAKEN